MSKPCLHLQPIFKLLESRGITPVSTKEWSGGTAVFHYAGTIDLEDLVRLILIERPVIKWSQRTPHYEPAHGFLCMEHRHTLSWDLPASSPSKP
jgi:hypothetical protein